MNQPQEDVRRTLMKLAKSNGWDHHCWGIRPTTKGWEIFFHPYGCENEFTHPLTEQGVSLLVSQVTRFRKEA